MTLRGQFPDVPSTKALVGLLIGVLLVMHPVVGNGPGPDTQYSYSVAEIDFADKERVEELYRTPNVTYGFGSQVELVREARNGTLTRPTSSLEPRVLDLIDVRYLADDVHDHYYRIHASVTNDTFQLQAARVSGEVVAKHVAVSPDEADPVIRKVLDGQQTASKRVNATVVRQDDRYLLVRPVETKRVSDPFAVVKIAGYALGIALIIGSLVRQFHRNESNPK
jgi:hypothetical protein